MRNICHYVLLCILFGAISICAGAEDIIAIKADRVDTVTSGVIENGIIVIADGKIKAIGNDIEIPETAEVIDVPDKTIFPGLVNPSSRIGLSSAARGGPASNPHYRVVDELYPHQDQYKRILGAGFTTIGLLPGEKGFVRYYSGFGFMFGGSSPSTGITGQGAIVRPIGQKSEEMIDAEEAQATLDELDGKTEAQLAAAAAVVGTAGAVAVYANREGKTLCQTCNRVVDAAWKECMFCAAGMPALPSEADMNVPASELAVPVAFGPDGVRPPVSPDSPAAEAAPAAASTVGVGQAAGGVDSVSVRDMDACPECGRPVPADWDECLYCKAGV